MRGKYVRITVASVVMIGGVFAIGSIVRHRSPQPLESGVLQPEVIFAEAETFALASKALAYANGVDGEQTKRTLDNFHALRAFPGAPPVIPHALLEDKSMGAGNCLGCHRDGGFTPVFKAYAPVTPHPQMENCRQCHVPQQKAAPFVASTWQRMAAPEVDGQHLAGAPPPIPHTLQMRENCLACHAGPAAVAKIRTPHPERVNCRQCHVPQETNEVFQRAAGGVQ
jgi:cytochrome c-type protein NapB